MWISALAIGFVAYQVYQRLKQRSLWTIPGPRSGSFLTGNYKQMFHPSATEYHDELRKKFGSVFRISGLLGDSQLVISDPMALTSILLKEQDLFPPSQWFRETNRLGLGPGLFAQVGAHHRKQRKILNPVFSNKHMRSMTPLFHQITHQLRSVLLEKVAAGPREVDLLDWFGRLALELVAQGGLGYSFDSLNPHKEDTESDFGTAIKQFVPHLSAFWVFRTIFPVVSRWPSRVLRFGVKCLPLPTLTRLVKVVDIMHENTKHVFDEKKEALLNGDQEFRERMDIISILMRENVKVSQEDKMPDDEIIGQMASLIFAATDTTSTALSRIIHLLSMHPEVQNKLRKELTDAYAAAGNNELGYDELVELPYLDAICRETLRVYPPLNFIVRVCSKDVSIPLSQPIQTTAGPISSLFIPRDTSIWIGIRFLNCDPNIWGPDASEWKPERWLSPHPQSVSDARIPGIYSNMMTFIGGGRACIGFKFSQLEMKVVLAQLIRSFRFSLTQAEVVWRFGGLTTPSVKGLNNVTPQMPMLLEKV
ncbi:cytochrome P450 [Artomyces pyxidatus]|uniref:Cytochrome P450 n=1 Tax=Artomyces pyxidatus TaxID=48021 RepID=A0ACB8SJQ4_9AGAM|nr:cytochrome P450 [Artomyces pyxidatus]